MSVLEDSKYQSGDPVRPEDCPSNFIISPDTRREDRIPPGQSRTRKWPVLDAFGPPLVDLADWQLRVFGLVERPFTLTRADFNALPRVKVFSDFHCVTKWSRLGNVWEGVATRTLLDRAGVKPEARFVVCHGYDNGWTTNLPLNSRQRADLSGTRRTRARTRPAALCVEECEVDFGHRTHRRRPSRLLGRGGLSHARRPVDGRTVSLGPSPTGVFRRRQPIAESPLPVE